MNVNGHREDANVVMQKVLGHLDLVVEHVSLTYSTLPPSTYLTIP